MAIICSFAKKMTKKAKKRGKIALRSAKGSRKEAGGKTEWRVWVGLRGGGCRRIS